MKRLLLALPFALAACADSVTAPSKSVAPAVQPSFVVSTDVTVKNWTVYNRSDFFAKLWDNNKATALPDGGVGFTFPMVSSTWYTAYLMAHYNRDLTDKTITAEVSVTGTDAVFFSRKSTTPGDAYVRLVIKSAEGNWGVNDYWWPTTGAILLSELGTGDISASTENPANWSNICGQLGSNESPYTAGESCVPGLMYPAESPAEGFTRAMKNVKEVGLSFGGSGGYAVGVAVTGGSANFQLNSFTITP